MARPQTCKRCGRVQHVVWTVSDEVWHKFCKKTGWNPNKTLCLECFAEMVGYVIIGQIPDDRVKFEPLWEEEDI